MPVFSEDDEVDFEEFYEFVKTLPDPTGELELAFHRFDRNKDGYIDKQELRGTPSHKMILIQVAISSLTSILEIDIQNYVLTLVLV